MGELVLSWILFIILVEFSAFTGALPELTHLSTPSLTNKHNNKI